MRWGQALASQRRAGVNMFDLIQKYFPTYTSSALCDGFSTLASQSEGGNARA